MNSLLKTAELDGEYVVFLLGARVNKWWLPHKWIPVARMMPKMLAELEAHPELGLLGYEQFGGRTTCAIQYWRSLEQLMDYARAKDSEHLPAWKEFNQRLRQSDAVGLWHETYRIRPGDYENVYHAMPPFGLGQVGKLRQTRSGRARVRIGMTISPDTMAV